MQPKLNQAPKVAQVTWRHRSQNGRIMCFCLARKESESHSNTSTRKESECHSRTSTQLEASVATVVLECFALMDDLSINISGLAPAVARTAAAVQEKRREPRRKSTRLAEARAQARPEAPEAEAKSKPEKRKRTDREPRERKLSKREQVLEAWKRTSVRSQRDSRQEKAAAFPASSNKAGRDKREHGVRDGHQKEPKRKASKPAKTAKKLKAREKPRDTAELKESGVVSETTFPTLKLHESLLRQLEYLGFTDCTPIQALAIPRALTGKRDVLLRAPTGSGKTLAFLLPVLHQLLASPGGLDRRTADVLERLRAHRA